MVSGLLEVLQRNKAVRTFLGAYNDADHKEVLKLLALLGILAAKGSSLPLGDVEALRQLVSTGSAASTVDGALPEVKQKLQDLKLQLEDVEQDIDKASQGVMPLACRSCAETRQTCVSGARSWVRLSPYRAPFASTLHSLNSSGQRVSHRHVQLL
jgi:hypothetical protein